MAVQTYDNTNQVAPVVTDFRRTDNQSDPRVRELYFGGPDSPGMINQAYSAAQKGYLDNPFQAKGVAGFSPFANRAMEGVYSGIGGYKPYLDFQQGALLQGMGTVGEQRGLTNQALEGYQRAGEMQQPYLSQAENQYGAGFRDLQSSFGQQGPSARDFQRASLQGFDPRSTAAYNNPFENQVVQQTIDDVFKQGEIADIGQRARDISSGGQSAFGSRAKLGAEERRAALGRGLGEALSGIRQRGFDQAQGRAIDESRFGRGALERAGAFEAGLGRDMSGARRGYASDMMGIGQRRGDIARTGAGDLRSIAGDIGGLGRQYADYGRDMGNLGGMYSQMGRDERSELMGFDRDARGMNQAGIDAQYAADERNRFAPMKALQYVQGYAPQYQGGGSNVVTNYGMPNDPAAQGLGAFLSGYTNYANAGQGQGQQGGMTQDMFNQMMQNFQKTQTG